MDTRGRRLASYCLLRPSPPDEHECELLTFSSASSLHRQRGICPPSGLLALRQSQSRMKIDLDRKKSLSGNSTRPTAPLKPSPTRGRRAFVHPQPAEDPLFVPSKPSNRKNGRHDRLHDRRSRLRDAHHPQGPHRLSPGRALRVPSLRGRHRTPLQLPRGGSPPVDVIVPLP